MASPIPSYSFRTSSISMAKAINCWSSGCAQQDTDKFRSPKSEVRKKSENQLPEINSFPSKNRFLVPVRNSSFFRNSVFGFRMLKSIQPKTWLQFHHHRPYPCLMLAKVCSAAVNGIEAYPVEVEANAGIVVIEPK